MVEATVKSDGKDDQILRGLATLGVIDRRFIGARAFSTADDFIGGVVSRAFPGDSGLSGIVGTVSMHDAATSGGRLIRLCPPEDADEIVRVITSPGVVERVGVLECRRLRNGDAATFELDRRAQH